MCFEEISFRCFPGRLKSVCRMATAMDRTENNKSRGGVLFGLSPKLNMNKEDLSLSQNTALHPWVT